MIPQPFYELLPYIYMLIGLFGLIGLESGWGKLCSLVLIAAGIVVQQLRARYRIHDRLFRKLNPEPSVPVTTEPRSRRSMPEPCSARTNRLPTE